MRRIEGVVQHYAWGDPTFIPELLGLEPDGRPWAELWLGTHPNGPATLDDGTALSSLTGELPYLLKVLSAAEPLSLQTHPTTEQARAGHERGVFGDPYDKPELIVALTGFEALCGVRPEAGSIELLREIGAYQLADVVAVDGAAAAIVGLYRGDIDPNSTIDACGDSTRPEAVWAHDLAGRYPGDPSVAVSLLLNLVRLQPGEALHLAAGNLHGYLRGSGIELMRASDNVVRGGLTEKHVDIDLLLDIVDLSPFPDPVLSSTDGRYELPEAGVALVRLEAGAHHVATSAELSIGLDGATGMLRDGEHLTATTPTFIVVRTG